MNSMFRLAARSATNAPRTRFYTTEASKPRITPIRGSIIGFLVGMTAASTAGYFYLLDEYNSAASALLKSLQELQTSTEKVKDYARRIEAIDGDVTKLSETAATKKQLADLKADLRKLYDTLNMEHLELKTHVWGLEKDISGSLKDHKE